MKLNAPRFAFTSAAFALALAALPSLAAAAPRAGQFPLTVCINQDIRDSNLILAGPSAVLLRLGIAVRWHGLASCPGDALRIRVLREAPPDLSPAALGCAHPLAGRDGELYMNRVEGAVSRDMVDTLAGYVITHEIVHLLEGEATRHADAGVMRSRWENSDVLEMAQGLRLTNGDIELVRRGVDRRTRLTAGGKGSSPGAVGAE